MQNSRKRMIPSIEVPLLSLLIALASVLPCMSSRWSSETRLTDYPLPDYQPAITQTQDRKVWILWERNYYGDDSIFYVTFQGTQKSSEKILITRNSVESKLPALSSLKYCVDYVTPSATTYKLTVQQPVTGGGTTDPPPGTYTYPEGTTVSVLAIPNQGYYFDRWVLNPMPIEWTFDLGANPASVTMDADYAIRPIFTTQSTALQHTSPSITQLSNGTIMVVWCARIEGSPERLYFTTSSDGGSQWSTMHLLPLTDNTNVNLGPTVMQARNGSIWVVWHSYRESNYDIYYKTYNGISWSTDQRLTYDSNIDLNPSIFQTQDNKIWITWGTDRTGDEEIYYKTYDGSWSTDQRLTEDTSHDDGTPTIFQMRNGTIWIMWASEEDSDTGGASHIFYKVSNDNGSLWSASVQFSTDPNEDQSPIAVQTMIPREIWAVWSSNRTEDWDIWYRKTIVLEGDLNEDEIVDIEDLVIVGLSWGTQRDQPHYSAVADTNDDDAVEIEDLALVGRNFGKSL